NAGKQMVLSKPQTTLGRAGVQVVVISRHHDAYAIAHVEGERAPLLNGAALGKLAQPLCHGDSIDLDGTLMKFTLV
ncbi:MAG TPA: phosphopeptide-binding protein, partial [Janthinobacterium sp.]|nr:phosphopeptide-binding protein [Janthinobacterium sp.]